MAKPKSWIKLNRNILEWGWYTEANTMRVFIHLLLKANVEDKIYQGIPVRRGEILTGYPALSKDLNLSVRNVRTAIEHLKSTGEVTVITYPKGSLIVIENYEKYQDVPVFPTNKIKSKKGVTGKVTGNRQATDRQLTGSRQASDSLADRQPTTTKEYKNIRNKEYKENKENRASPVSPSAVSSGYVPKAWERDEVPEMLWGKFETVAEWEAWRDK